MAKEKKKTRYPEVQVTGTVNIKKALQTILKPPPSSSKVRGKKKDSG